MPEIPPEYSSCKMRHLNLPDIAQKIQRHSDYIILGLQFQWHQYFSLKLPPYALIYHLQIRQNRMFNVVEDDVSSSSKPDQIGRAAR